MDQILGVKEVIQKRDSVAELFKQGKLLTRVVRQPVFSKDGIDIDSWKGEIDSMKQEGGMEHTSTTMILEDKGIEMYNNAYGFLFNSDLVGVEHVALTDSGSGLDSAGGLRANPADFTDLGGLRNYYKERETTFAMNEVNATVTTDAIVGVVLRSGVKNPNTLLQLGLFAKTLSDSGIEVPIYEYDEHKGEINSFDLPSESDLLNKVREEYLPLYKKAFEI